MTRITTLKIKMLMPVKKVLLETGTHYIKMSMESLCPLIEPSYTTMGMIMELSVKKACSKGGCR